MESSNTPPTLPPLPPVRNHGQKQSAYLASLEAAGPNFMDTAFGMHVEPEPYRPTFYFFYGTLTKPEILEHVLNIEEEPALRPARVLGYALTLWGQYSALIDGNTGEEVKGYAYQVQSVEHEYKLARYETSAYKLEPCWIRFTDVADEDSAKVRGNTFMYAGDTQALQAGRFDRTLWELQMGMRLPDAWRTPPPPFKASWDEADGFVTDQNLEKGKDAKIG